ncbi:hypothetical protein ACPA9J_34800 [Pseudomonas aeruginosa]
MPMPAWRGGYGFLLRRGDTNLLRVVNSAIGAINQDRLESIARRWVGSGSRQRASVSRRRRRRVAGSLATRWCGWSSTTTWRRWPSSIPTRPSRASPPTCWTLISRRTGLHFPGHASQWRLPRADRRIGQEGGGPGDHEPRSKREEMLRFTRSFLSTSYVLVTRADDKGRAEIPGSLDGKRIAIPPAMWACNGCASADRRPRWWRSASRWMP